MSLLDWVKDAGAKREEDSERDGAFSWHAESHSFGVGAGVVWFALVTGDMALLGVVIPAVTSGLRAKDREFSRILTDVYQEPHYALLGVLVGSVLALPWAAIPF